MSFLVFDLKNEAFFQKEPKIRKIIIKAILGLNLKSTKNYF